MMKKIKKFYIIPGFGESCKKIYYKKIAKLVTKLGFKAEPIEIKWDLSKTFSDYSKEVSKQLKIHKDDGSHILGFSFGAYIISILPKAHKFKKIYFCSISPYFKDDIKHLPKELVEYFGGKFITNASKNVFTSRDGTEALFFVGENEPEYSINRTKKSFKIWLGKKKLLVIDSADHDISKTKYLKEILNKIKNA